MRRIVLAAAFGSLAAAPALAIDCTRAATPVEKTICGKPALKAADDALGAAYSALRAGLDAAGKTALRGDQLDWLKRRDGICTEWDPATPPDAACLMRETLARTDMLKAKPARSGPGAPAFRPVFLRQVDEAARIEISVVYPQVVDADSKALRDLNTILAKLSTGAVPDMGEGNPEGPYGRTLSFRIGYASGSFVSILYDAYEFTGGAHGMSYTGGVNFLPDQGRVLAGADLFDPRGLAELTTYCRDRLAAEKRLRGGAEDDIADALNDGAVSANIIETRNWTFDDRGATIHYEAYALGSYAEGAYECLVPWRDLHAMVKPGAPLPRD